MRNAIEHGVEVQPIEAPTGRPAPTALVAAAAAFVQFDRRCRLVAGDAADINRAKLRSVNMQGALWMRQALAGRASPARSCLLTRRRFASGGAFCSDCQFSAFLRSL